MCVAEVVTVSEKIWVLQMPWREFESQVAITRRVHKPEAR